MQNSQTIMEKPRQDWLTYTSKNWNRQNVLSVGGNPASYWHWLLHLWVTSTKLHQKGHIRGGIAEQFNFRNAFLPHVFLSKSIHQQQLVCWVSPREKFQLFLPLLIFSDSSGIPIRQDWNFRTYKIATSLKLTGSILQKSIERQSLFLWKGMFSRAIDVTVVLWGIHDSSIALSRYFLFPMWGSKPPWRSGEIPKALWPAQGFRDIRISFFASPTITWVTWWWHPNWERRRHENNPTISQFACPGFS